MSHNKRHRTREEWRRIVRNWQSSDTRQQDFCAEMGVSSGMLSHWIGEFAKEAASNAGGE